ncbi:MAG: hypothetical protein ACRDPQ_20185 [Nocardioidaceae bacterium]
MRRLSLLIVALVVVIAAVVVVAILVWPSSTDDPIDDALAVMPADTTTMTFTDAAATRERLGYGNLNSESPADEVEPFVSDAIDVPWSTSSLGAYYVQMDDWSWNFLDVEWEAADVSEDVSATAFKLRDDIDMDAVQAEFADRGYEESDVDGYPAYSLDISDLSVDEYPIPSLLNVIVIPDEQLLLTGPHAEVLIGPATDDADSLADSDLADDLVGEVENPEYLQLSLGDSSCVDAMEALVPDSTPESTEELAGALAETPGYEDLQPITGHVAGIAVPDGEPVAQAAAAAYDDDDSAAADVDPRAEFVAEGTSVVTGQPYSELVSAEVESDGSMVTYDLGGGDTTLQLPRMFQSRDLPWAVCPPDSDG